MEVAAKPLSRNRIRFQAEKMRCMLGIEPDEQVDIVYVLEVLIPKIYPDFELKVVEEDSEDLYPDELARSEPDNNITFVRRSVYERAVAGVPRDRFTLSHEFGHILEHPEDRIVKRPNSFSRGKKAPLKTYEDPEWQANTFAAEFLMNKAGCKGLSVPEAAAKYGVSYQVAEIQLRQYGYL